MRQLQNLIEGEPEDFQSDKFRIAFTVSLLEKQALQWYYNYKDQSWGTKIITFEDLVKELLHTFKDPGEVRKAVRELKKLYQGNWSAHQYGLKFQELGFRTGWDDLALRDMYYDGLEAELKAKLAEAFYHLQLSLPELMRLAEDYDQIFQMAREEGKSRKAESDHPRRAAFAT